jgi:hypothetical protein
MEIKDVRARESPPSETWKRLLKINVDRLFWN